MKHRWFLFWVCCLIFQQSEVWKALTVLKHQSNPQGQKITEGVVMPLSLMLDKFNQVMVIQLFALSFFSNMFLINVVAQTLPTMVHDYIQYLINVVAIRIMSTSWRNGFSWKVLTSDVTHNGTWLRSEVTMCWIYAYCSPWLQGLPLSKCLTFHFYPTFHQVGS